MPCREGVRRMREILEDICAGKGSEGDVDLLEHISTGVADGSLCALGGSALPIRCSALLNTSAMSMKLILRITAVRRASARR